MTSYLSLLLSLFVVDLMAAMSPGPNFILVTQSAVRRTRAYAMAVVVGFTIANLIWCIAVVLGLAALFDVQPWLYEVIRVFGGAYLVYLGVQIWLGRETAGEGRQVDLGERVATGIFRGIVTNLGNPKSAIYFGSIFAAFMKPGTPLWVQLCAIAIVLVDTIIWYGSVAAVLSVGRSQRLFFRFKRAIDRLAGALMLVFGLRLLTSRS